jgi:hypothetical protein
MAALNLSFSEWFRAVSSPDRWKDEKGISSKVTRCKISDESERKRIIYVLLVSFILPLASMLMAR